MERRFVTVEGNEAAAYVAHQANEVIAIYPITPASPMGEWADQWAAEGRPNLWGSVPQVVELQSEAGAAGAIHGALQGDVLAPAGLAARLNQLIFLDKWAEQVRETTLALDQANLSR